MPSLVGVYQSTDDAALPFRHSHVSMRIPKEGEFVPISENKVQQKAWSKKIWRIGVGTLTDDYHITDIHWLNED